MEMVDKNISSQFIISDAISEVIQYNFNMDYFKVSPKHSKPHRNKYDYMYIAVLKTMKEPFKVVNTAK